MANPKPVKSAVPSDLIWGAPEIGAVLGIKPAQVYYFYATGRLTGAVWKFSPKRLVASRRKLSELADRLTADEATAA